MANQPRTLPARNNFFVQNTKLRELFRHEPTMAGVSSFVSAR
jgi:hypothetical protein